MKNFDILFVFPPAGNHEHPHLGLPLLKGYLKNRGVENSVIRDYNAPLMEDILIRELRHQSDERDMAKNYQELKEIMRGTDPESVLKSGIALNIISKYLRMLGDSINKQSLDPASFHRIINEYNNEEYEDAITDYINNTVISDIIRHNARIIGFSVVFPSQIFYMLYICREIRRKCLDVKIVLGGPQISLFWKALTARLEIRPLFDALVLEQGEIPMYELAMLWLENEGCIEDIPNIIYCAENGDIVKNNTVGSVTMDEVAVPDFSDYNLSDYAFAKLPYMLSRGCYWGLCRFCGYRGNKNEYIESSVERVISDLAYMRDKYNVNIFHFMDDAISPAYLDNLSTVLIEKKLNITYAAYLKTEKEFTADLCRKLYKSGLKSVLFGFESANNRILQEMHKNSELETTVNVLENFRKSGIMNYLSCIIGFPTETREEAFETIEFLKNNKHLYYKAYITPFRLMPGNIDDLEESGIYDIDIYNPVRHDINGYISLEIPFRCKHGMTNFEYMDMVSKAREVAGTTPHGPIFYR